MFDAVRNNKRIVQVFLALIALPFAFFGVDSYIRNMGSDGSVAKIGDIKITQQQFQEALRAQQDSARNQGEAVDPKFFEQPEIRKSILDNLINERVLLLEAQKRHLVVSDDDVRRVRDSIEEFKVDGKFSPEQAAKVLGAQGMTPDGFVAKVRQQLTLQQLIGGLGQSGFASRTVADRVIALQGEKRTVQEFLLPLTAYLPQVKLEADAAKKFYDENNSLFQVPEQARAEFVVLSLEDVASQISVSDAEVKEVYEKEKNGRYGVPEERRASHILFTSENGDKAKARAKAEEVLKEVQKNPAAFADFAKKYSEDQGSAKEGGDIGFFRPGAMAKPFEETVFKLKEGEISGIVETDFGFHIIKVTGIHPARTKEFAEVRPEIEDGLKKQKVASKFAEMADAFRNMVYEQPDSLKPAADKLKLAIKQTGWLTRQPNPANGPFANPKVLAALFSDDAIKSKHNTEAIQVAPNTMIAARIAEYKPASLQPFDTVKGDIETMLKNREALALAKKDGEAKLEQLKKGEDKQAWNAAKTVSRLDPRQVNPQALPVIFKADAGKLPSYVGIELSGIGYGLYKVVKVEAGDAIDDARKQAMVRQVGGLVMQEEMQAYIAALRARYKVEINQAALESKEK